MSNHVQSEPEGEDKVRRVHCCDPELVFEGDGVAGAEPHVKEDEDNSGSNVTTIQDSRTTQPVLA